MLKIPFALTALAFVVLANVGCTCFIPSTGFLTWRTNHTVLPSFDDADHEPAYRIRGTVLHYKKWERKPFSIANTEDCAREVRMTVGIDQPAPGDEGRETIELTYRGQHWIGLPRGYNLEDLLVDDRVEIGYDLSKSGSPRNIVVIINRETASENYDRSIARFHEELQRQEKDESGEKNQN